MICGVVLKKPINLLYRLIFQFSASQFIMDVATFLSLRPNMVVDFAGIWTDMCKEAGTHKRGFKSTLLNRPCYNSY